MKYLLGGLQRHIGQWYLSNSNPFGQNRRQIDPHLAANKVVFLNKIKIKLIINNKEPITKKSQYLLYLYKCVINI